MTNTNNEALHILRRRIAKLERAPVAAARRNRSIARGVTIVALAGLVALPGVASAVEIPNMFSNGDFIIADDFNENFEVLADAISSRTISDDLTIDIGPADGCGGITEALESLEDVSITGAATVTVSVAEGIYFCTAPVELNHPNGGRIRLEGAGLPANTVLSFPGYGVRARFGHSLGSLANLTLRGNDTEVGVDVRAASSVRLENVIVEAFEVGVQVRESAAVSGGHVTARDNVGHGFVAFRSGSLSISNAIAETNGGNGFWAYENGSISLALASQATSNGAEGYAATNGSTIVATSPSSEGNGQSGFISSVNSTLVVTDASATDNGVYGFAAIRGGYVRRNGSVTASGNAGGGVNELPNSPNTNHGAVIND